MTEETQHNAAHNFQNEFNALPLDQKFVNLLQMEVATLNEAVKHVADSSMKVFEQIGVAISDFGTKVETEAKKATDCSTSTEQTKSATNESNASSEDRPPESAA